MDRSDPESQARPDRTRFSRFATLSLVCLGVVVLLMALHWYLDGKAPYREIGGYPKDRVVPE